MQYFVALKLGQKRVASAREYLNNLANNRAMPALALKSSTNNVWEPVGEENLYAIVDESSGFVLTDTSGYIVALCDKDGYSKSIIQGVQKEQCEQMVQQFEKDNMPKYVGKVILPV